ncbi:MAG: type IV pilus twitching motility protein PilT [Acidobacteriota bacterium]
MALDDLLRRLIGSDVSDLHFKVGRPPLLRKNGALVNAPGLPPLSADDTAKIAYGLLKGPQREELKTGVPVDGSYQLGDDCRFRVNVFRQRNSAAIVLRQIPMTIPDFEDLNLPPVMREIADENRGLALVTGVTGSGKSTTLACMMNFINRRRKVHILTIEDPIEFLYKDNVSSISQVEIGFDAPGFGDALRSSLRQDPDIILVGEMRDLETVKTGLKAAEMGYMVFSTLHTTDAVKTINRILDVFPGHQQQQVRYQLAGTLRAVISQRLLPRADGKGRRVAMEILRSNATVKDYIENAEKTSGLKDVVEGGRDQYGMQTFDQHLTMLYNEGVITLETAMEASSSPADFQRALSFE